jgi:molybdopterin synthase sulfur carrier subunit
MDVLLFGVLTDVVGKQKLELKANDIDSLKKILMEKFPALQKYKFQFAVNREKTEENILLNEEDVVALLPPFAGG